MDLFLIIYPFQQNLLSMFTLKVIYQMIMIASYITTVGVWGYSLPSHDLRFFLELPIYWLGNHIPSPAVSSLLASAYSPSIALGEMIHHRKMNGDLNPPTIIWSL